jgi:hypothetical protein
VAFAPETGFSLFRSAKNVMLIGFARLRRANPIKSLMAALRAALKDLIFFRREPYMLRTTKNRKTKS